MGGRERMGWGARGFGYGGRGEMQGGGVDVKGSVTRRARRWQGKRVCGGGGDGKAWK